MADEAPRESAFTRATAPGTPSPPGALHASPLTEKRGDFVGDYRLLEVIGEGGFGVVWLAERREPMVQRVALKVIKPGMDSRAVIARFEQERQALAVMDHPNVARVLDGGVSAAGRPYFVMEHVRGEPLTTFCDRHRLTIRDRLALFIPVCDAVHHAHMKGIIHRDLKPSNILVGLTGEERRDGAAPTRGMVVKVIDFGVAKAISHTLTDKTIFTETGQIIGTPEYMSPEQAEMGATDIDTRTDVYSLGVVLYELLSGTLPFDPESLRSAGQAEIRRLIREVDPPRPSVRLSTVDDQVGAAIARARQAERERIAWELRRELEWIPLKAMRKDRSRRYASAESLAADVRRYLDGLPLEAAPESRVYLARKLLRRNRVPAIAASAVALALAAGVGATGLSLRRALRAESDLRVQLAETERAQRAEAARAEELREVSEFQENMLGQIDPTLAGVRLAENVSTKFAAALEKSGLPDHEHAAQVRSFGEGFARLNATDLAAELIDETILKPAIAAVDAQFHDQPLVDAQLRQAIAGLYRNIGLDDAARPLLESALATRRRALGDEHPDTLDSLRSMGALLLSQHHVPEAEACIRETLETRRRVLGEDHPDTLESISDLGVALSELGRLEEAEACYSEALEKRRRALGAAHPDTLASVHQMGALLHRQGRLAEAEPYLREALEQRRRALGEDHIQTLHSLTDLASVLGSQGRLAEAEPYFAEALDSSRRVLGESHPRTLIAINNMGFVIRVQGRLEEAEPHLREAMDKSRIVLGAEHAHTLEFVHNVGLLLFDQGRLSEAEPHLRQVMEARRRVLGDAHPQTIASLSAMGTLLRGQGHLSEAEPYQRETLEGFRRVVGEGHPNTLAATNNLAELLVDLGRAREAVELLAPVDGAMRRVFAGPNLPWLALYLTTLGRAHAGLGDAEGLARAEASLLEAHAILAPARGENHQDTLGCVRALVDLYADWEAAAPGQNRGAKAAEWRARLAPVAVD